MANNGPNRTAWAFKNRKTWVQREQVAYNANDAEVVAQEWRATGEYVRVVVRQFKVGPTPYKSGRPQQYNWIVRAYA